MTLHLFQKMWQNYDPVAFLEATPQRKTKQRRFYTMRVHNEYETLTICSHDKWTKKYSLTSPVVGVLDRRESKRNPTTDVKCYALILSNLAQPQLTDVNCHERLGFVVYCANNNSQTTFSTLSSENAFLCSKAAVVVNTDCFRFVWGYCPEAHTHSQRHRFQVKMLQFLFDAVSSPFPAIFSSQCTHKIVHLKCSRIQKGLTYQSHKIIKVRPLSSPK